MPTVSDLAPPVVIDQSEEHPLYYMRGNPSGQSCSVADLQAAPANVAIAFLFDGDAALDV